MNSDEFTALTRRSQDQSEKKANTKNKKQKKEGRSTPLTPTHVTHHQHPSLPLDWAAGMGVMPHLGASPLKKVAALGEPNLTPLRFPCVERAPTAISPPRTGLDFRLRMLRTGVAVRCFGCAFCTGE